MKQFIAISLLLATPSSAYSQRTLHAADSLRSANHIPELAYAVADSRSTLEMAASGRHSVALPDTASLNDRFHLGSNTKAMTAFMIAKYVEKGTLQWTSKFFDLFPEWKDKSHPAYANITLQELLSHRAGIPPFQGQVGFQEEIKLPPFTGTTQQKRTQYGQFVLSQEPVKPSEQEPFIYSNAGYVLAAIMLEKASGKSWEQLIEKVFNHDLKLNVRFSWPENQSQRDTWGHSEENDTLRPVPSNTTQRVELDEPAGDLNIRLPDYVKFIQLHLQGLEGKDNYLKASTYALLLKGQEHYAMGWFNLYEKGKELSTHGGTVGTYYSQVHIDRTAKKAYIIFTNAYSDSCVLGVKLLMRKLKARYGG